MSATDHALMTPLHLAVSHDSSPSSGARTIVGFRGSPGDAKESLAALVKANSPLHAKDSGGLTPLLRAAFAGNKPGVELLLTKATPKEKVEAGKSYRG